ncbi:MAG: hypothetical protein H6625_07670 [Bdellovibrionaceae bacterium]|nr:hypothetical protein [Pseudobdellovibrionaceae bacterium]
MNTFLLKFSLLFMLFPTLAHADFYSCNFTEPFYQIFLSTKLKRATIYDDPTGIGQSLKIVKSTTEGYKRSYNLENGKTISIDRNLVGNDGMSDQFYPFEIIYNGQLGGCDGEVVYLSATIERWASAKAPLGLNFVNYWPGEYGHVTGYKIQKTLTLPAKTTWSNLKYDWMNESTCTLVKNKKLVPILAAKNEIYAHLTPTESWGPRSNKSYLIAYTSENQCIVESALGMNSIECPDIQSPIKEVETHMPTAPYGNYVYTLCNEGYYTWIHEDVLNTHKNIKEINVN